MKANNENEEEIKQEEIQQDASEQEQNLEKGDAEDEDIEQIKTMAALAYLIFFLPLLVNPDSRFGKFHANQGLLLLITGLAINIVASVPFIGWFIILPLGFLFTVACFIIGVINATKGEMKRLPLIGGFDIIK